jgi:hypothetical protein
LYFGAASPTMQVKVRFRDLFDNDDCPRVTTIIERLAGLENVIAPVEIMDAIDGSRGKGEIKRRK